MFIVATSFVIVMDIVLDPMLYFFFNHISNKCLDRVVPARKLDVATGLKKDPGCTTQYPSNFCKDAAVIVGTGELHTVREVPDGMVVTQHIKRQTFETDEIIVHANGSQRKHNKVRGNLAIDDQSKVDDTDGTSNNNSSMNIVTQ